MKTRSLLVIMCILVLVVASAGCTKPPEETEGTSYSAKTSEEPKVLEGYSIDRLTAKKEGDYILVEFAINDEGGKAVTLEGAAKILIENIDIDVHDDYLILYENSFEVKEGDFKKYTHIEEGNYYIIELKIPFAEVGKTFTSPVLAQGRGGVKVSYLTDKGIIPTETTMVDGLNSYTLEEENELIDPGFDAKKEVINAEICGGDWSCTIESFGYFVPITQTNDDFFYTTTKYFRIDLKLKYLGNGAGDFKGMYLYDETGAEYYGIDNAHWGPAGRSYPTHIYEMRAGEEKFLRLYFYHNDDDLRARLVSIDTLKLTAKTTLSALGGSGSQTFEYELPITEVEN
ncbi:MAG: hypothetical protein ABIG20_01780 [archaeon]